MKGIEVTLRIDGEVQVIKAKHTVSLDVTRTKGNTEEDWRVVTFGVLDDRKQGLADDPVLVLEVEGQVLLTAKPLIEKPGWWDLTHPSQYDTVLNGGGLYE